MANTIKVKRSSVAGKVPTTGDLELGEIAINTFDGKMYFEKNNGTASVVQVGDVVGAASATDNALVRFDGTTGKLIQNSTNATLDDSGNLDVASAKVDYLQLDTAATPAGAVGRFIWDDGEGTATLGLKGGNVSLQLGQEQLALCYNGSGSTIANGAVVAVTGAQGSKPSIVLADADSEALSASTLGVATESIANGAEGFVNTFGLVRNVDTSAFTAGAPLYLSQTAGGLTMTRPSAPAHTVFIGWAIKINASSGEIFLNINNGWELDELHNVYINNPLNNQGLFYELSTDLWKNKSIATVLGYAPAPIESPTFTGAVVLPSTTSIGNVSDTEIGYLDNVTSSIQTQIDGKLTIPVWTDYTSTQVGWSSTTTFLVRYFLIGKMVTVYFRVTGTSNSTTTTITMPFINNGTSNIGILTTGLNNSNASIVSSSIATTGNILSASYFSAIATLSSFTATGTKQIAGTITYEIP